MKKLLLILLCLPMIGFGQGWEKTYGNMNDQAGQSVKQTFDGGFIVTGVTNGVQGIGNDVYLIKTDNNGIEQWSQNYGGLNNDVAREVQQTSDGGYIITGVTESFGNGYIDVYLIKVDSAGVIEWYNTFGGSGDDRGECVQQTNDGGFIISGITNSFGAGEYDIYLIKVDSNGFEQWTKTFGDTTSDISNFVQQTSDGGYILTGQKGGTDSSSTNNYNHDIYTIKTDSNGVEQWSFTKDISFLDYSYGIEQTNDGGYIITGYVWPLATNPFLIKLDSLGLEDWTQIYNVTNNIGYSNYVQQTNDGGYIIAGTRSCSNPPCNGYDIFIMKTDELGIYQWDKIYGDVLDDRGECVQQTNDGGFIITGFTESVNTSKDLYLIKTDSFGCVTNYFQTITINCGTFIWDGNLFSQSGVYNRTYVNSNGCDSIVTINLTIKQKPSANIYSSVNNLTIIPVNGQGPYSYLWNTGESTQSITPQLLGTYWAYVTGNNGCSSDTTFYNYSLSNIDNFMSEKKIFKISNLLGKKAQIRNNTPLFYIYDDGTVEKKLIIE